MRLTHFSAAPLAPRQQQRRMHPSSYRHLVCRATETSYIAAVIAPPAVPLHFKYVSVPVTRGAGPELPSEARPLLWERCESASSRPL